MGAALLGPELEKDLEVEGKSATISLEWELKMNINFPSKDFIFINKNIVNSCSMVQRNIVEPLHTKL